MATKYSQDFNIDAYLLTRFSSPGSEPNLDDEHRMRDFAMRKLHNYFWSKALAGKLTVLDYGCGPVIANVISAARVATTIVLAEYTEEGRSALRQWCDQDPSAFEWFPYFKYVVRTLEGGSTKQVEERMKRLRSIVKSIVPCDITKDPPIENDYQGPYDVVISCLCISNACKTKDDFVRAIFRLAMLIKSGGYLLLHIEEPKENYDFMTYSIGIKSYCALAVDYAFIKSTMEKNFQDITAERHSTTEFEDMLGTLFIAAYKK